MVPLKGEVPVFARLWPVRVTVRVSFTTGAVRSAILATAGLLVTPGPDIHAALIQLTVTFPHQN